MSDLIQRAVDQLKIDEGLRKFHYIDTVNVMTIGYGRNLESVGIREDEASLMLRNDVLTSFDALSKLPFWGLLNDVRRLVLVNMAVNLGMKHLLKFERMLAALHIGDFQQAAFEMISSEWSRQVKTRSLRLADEMRTGELRGEV